MAVKTAKDWIKELEREDKIHGEFRKKAEKVVERYEDEQKRSDSKFNILWSNVETIKSALYAKTPVPDVRRRFLDRDPNGKKAAELTERALSYCIDTYDFDGAIGMSLDDNLIAGMGLIRCRYEPYFDTKSGPPIYLDQREKGYNDVMQMEYGMFKGDEEITEYQMDGLGAYVEGDPIEELVYEEVQTEPVNWKRFRWQPAPRWEEVGWCAIEHYMTKDELKEHYPKHNDIPLNYTDKGEKTDPEKEDGGRALVYEIFDKKNRMNIEIADGYEDILKDTEDPLKLENYYPFPKPLMSTLKNGKFIPIPDYCFYQDQADELDTITNRIAHLTEQLRFRGVYDGAFKELQNLKNADDGSFYPVADFSKLLGPGTQGDLKKVFAIMPIEEIQRVLIGLYKQREEIKQTIYEITGIADIMRGTSEASETLGAQQLKTQFGSMRLQNRQKKVQMFIRDLLRIKAEIMVENFEPQTLSKMTGMELSGEVYQIIQDDLMRSYRIDIETDSTIAEDASQEKQNRVELVKAVTEFMGTAGPMVAQGFMPANFATELLGFAVRGFKVGRTLEDTLDEMGGDDQDPRMQAMASQFEQAKQQMQMQMQEQVQGMQEQAGKEIQQLQGKLFEAQKKNAITSAVNEAKMFESQIKADLQKSTKEYEAQLSAVVETFKAQLNAQQEETRQAIQLLGEQIRQDINQV